MGREHSKKQPHRSFSRTPFGKGWCVVKEELSVTDATVKEERCIFPTSLLWSSGVMKHQKFYPYVSLMDSFIDDTNMEGGGGYGKISSLETDFVFK
jgi:hypothetical protein